MRGGQTELLASVPPPTFMFKRASQLASERKPKTPPASSEAPFQELDMIDEAHAGIMSFFQSAEDKATVTND